MLGMEWVAVSAAVAALASAAVLAGAASAQAAASAEVARVAVRGDWELLELAQALARRLGPLSGIGSNQDQHWSKEKSCRSTLECLGSTGCHCMAHHSLCRKNVCCCWCASGSQCYM